MTDYSLRLLCTKSGKQKGQQTESRHDTPGRGNESKILKQGFLPESGQFVQFLLLRGPRFPFDLIEGFSCGAANFGPAVFERRPKCGNRTFCRRTDFAKRLRG